MLGSEELHKIFENEWLGVQTRLTLLNGKVQNTLFFLGNMIEGAQESTQDLWIWNWTSANQWLMPYYTVSVLLKLNFQLNLIY